MNSINELGSIDKPNPYRQSGYPSERKELENSTSNDTGDIQTDWTNPESFATLIPFGEYQTPEISANVLPKPLCEMAEAVSRFSQTPSGVSVMVILGILATCLQGKFEIAPKNNEYLEPLCLWPFIIQPPASRKTAVLKELKRPLDEWESIQRKEIAPQISKALTENSLIDEAIRQIERKPLQDKEKKNGADVLNKIKETTDEIERLKNSRVPVPCAQTLYISDGTTEAITRYLASSHGIGSVISDEPGQWDTNTQYSSGSTNIDILLSGHSAGTARIRRVGAGEIIIPQVLLTMALMGQPAFLEGLNKGKNKSLRGRGALARFLPFFPANNIGQRNVRDDFDIPASVRSQYASIITELLNIPLNYDPNNESVVKPRKLGTTEEAKELFLSFQAELEQRMGPGSDLADIQDWAGKLAGQAARIAALLHIMQHGVNQKSVDAETMTNAISICSALIPHAKKFFDMIGGDTAVADGKRALEWARNNYQTDQNGAYFIRQSASHIGLFKNDRKERVLKALDCLKERGYISARIDIPTRKPTLIYYLNPLVVAACTS